MWLRNNGWRLMSDQFMTDCETTISNKALGGMMYIAEIYLVCHRAIVRREALLEELR